MSIKYTLILFNATEEIKNTQFSKAMYFNILGSRGGRFFKYDIELPKGSSALKQQFIASILSDAIKKRQQRNEQRRLRRLESKKDTTKSKLSQHLQKLETTKNELSNRLTSVGLKVDLIDKDQYETSSFSKARYFNILTKRNKQLLDGYVKFPSKLNVEGKINFINQISKDIYDSFKKKIEDKKKQERKEKLKQKAREENRKRLEEFDLKDYDLPDNCFKDRIFGKICYERKVTFYSSSQLPHFILRHIHYDFKDSVLDIGNSEEGFLQAVPLLTKLFKKAYNYNKTFETTNDFLFRIKYLATTPLGKEVVKYHSLSRVRKLHQSDLDRFLVRLYDYWIECFYRGTENYYKRGYYSDVYLLGIEFTATVYPITNEEYKQVINH